MAHLRAVPLVLPHRGKRQLRVCGHLDQPNTRRVCCQCSCHSASFRVCRRPDGASLGRRYRRRWRRGRRRRCCSLGGKQWRRLCFRLTRPRTSSILVLLIGRRWRIPDSWVVHADPEAAVQQLPQLPDGALALHHHIRAPDLAQERLPDAQADDHVRSRGALHEIQELDANTMPILQVANGAAHGLRVAEDFASFAIGPLTEPELAGWVVHLSVFGDSALERAHTATKWARLVGTRRAAVAMGEAWLVHSARPAQTPGAGRAIAHLCVSEAGKFDMMCLNGAFVSSGR